MFTYSKDAVYETRNRFIWYLLSLQGGFVNVGGLLSVHQYVSHVTGSSGLFAHALYRLDALEMLTVAAFPLFFLLGSFITGIFTAVRRESGLRPIYVWVSSGITFIYVMIFTLGTLGYLGRFNEPMSDLRDFIVVALLCLACGAQNALFTHASGAVVRTTHLTGITTDLGIGLAKVLFNHEHRKHEMRANYLRIGIIASFVLGSILAFPTFTHFQFAGFAIPSLISFIVLLRLYFSRRKLEQT